MLKPEEMALLRQLARGIAAQFGSGCEVVIHQLGRDSAEHSVAAIENGHVTGRQVGDGPSQVVLQQLQAGGAAAADQYGYLTRTPDGKLLKSSTMYIRDQAGQVAAIFSINFDISALSMVDRALGDLLAPRSAKPPARIAANVTDLLEDLLEQSVELIGKPVALMTKDDKARAVRFLSGKGALLITKSGDRIAKYFGISKYTLYSYLDMKTGGEQHD